MQRHACSGASGPKGNRKKSVGRILACLQICALVVLWGYAGQSVNAAPVNSADEKLVCGDDSRRPDRSAGLREQSVSTPDGSIAYYRFGHGSPVIFFTGYRATIAEWNTRFLGELAAQHEIILYDNRGVGRSVTGGARFGIKDMASDAARLISALGVHDATIVG
ncbi:alpha/beta fold hydrolase [Pantoea vagans]|uniref:alpha/beta fold hydrolase n=1 Tax=Pantoea vagans TaxID=470934 RepID=UPI0023B1CBA8|nr:alpha/beta hydrolase [Pantoea vagans]MDE8559216.1 alpha/beta hydrolase [Pantoea vagans]MDE8579211.1 alpha/beta hydrolase [Pantoea vagans]